MSELKVQVENGKEYTIEEFSGSSAIVNEESMKWDSLKVKGGKFSIIKNNKSFIVEVVSSDTEAKTFELKINGNVYTTTVEDRFDILLKKLGMDDLGASAVANLKAPMPGMVLKIEVKEGQEVKKGDPLIVLEAMKMENVLKSPEDLIVKSIPVETGVAVEKNQVLVEFEA